MRCPSCGSSARIRNNGKSWECGWCGDSGSLYSHSGVSQQSIPITLTLSFDIEPEPESEFSHEIYEDDRTLYHYCKVRFESSNRSYPYLTGDLPLLKGDWVEVPWGKNNIPKTGQIVEVIHCDYDSAPCPPEEAKTVLRKADASYQPTLVLKKIPSSASISIVSDSPTPLTQLPKETVYPEASFMNESTQTKYPESATHIPGHKRSKPKASYFHILILSICFLALTILSGFFLHLNNLF